jgi:3-hydroxyisobutyrate dehydrogenase-like beta-hydroxyacid dehydrogenase
MEVLAEAQTLSEKSGIGAEVVQDLVKGKHI